MGIDVGVGVGVGVGVSVGVKVGVGVSVGEGVGVGVGVWVDVVVGGWGGVELTVTVAVGEGVEASAANTGISAGRGQTRAPPMRVTSKPRATAATGRGHRWRDAGAVDVDRGGGFEGAGEVIRRRAQRSAA